MDRDEDLVHVQDYVLVVQVGMQEVAVRVDMFLLRKRQAYSISLRAKSNVGSTRNTLDNTTVNALTYYYLTILESVEHPEASEAMHQRLRALIVLPIDIFPCIIRFDKLPVKLLVG